MTQSGCLLPAVRCLPKSEVEVPHDDKSQGSLGMDPGGRPPICWSCFEPSGRILDHLDSSHSGVGVRCCKKAHDTKSKSGTTGQRSSRKYTMGTTSQVCAAAAETWRTFMTKNVLFQVMSVVNAFLRVASLPWFRYLPTAYRLICHRCVTW